LFSAGTIFGLFLFFSRCLIPSAFNHIARHWYNSDPG
jgi:hypothetical protein